MNTHRWEKRDKNDTKMPHRTQPILKLHLARLHHVNSKGGKDSPSIALPHPPTQEILSKESRGITQKLQYQNEIKNTHNSSTLLKKNKTSMNGLERKKTKNNHQKKITHSLQQKQKAHVQMKSSPVTNIVIAESGRRSSDDLLFKQLSYCNDGRRRTSSTHQNTMTTSHETIKDDKSRTLKGSSDSSDYVDIKQSPYRSKSDYKTYDRGSGEDSSSWGNNCFDNEYSTESNNERNKPYSDDEFVNIHNDTYDKIKEVASLSKISSLLGQLCSKTKQFLSKLSLCISFAIALIAVILVSQHILNMRARKKKSTEKRMFTVPTLSPITEIKGIQSKIPSKNYSELPTTSTYQPSNIITNIPSKKYSESPTLLTSQYPSTRPSHVATHQPSKIITNNPSKVYSESPSFNPSQFFSKYPSTEPTLMPSKMFSGTPSNPYTWHQVGQVLTGRSKDGNEFGKSVSVSSDGKTIAVSSFKNDEILVFDNIGSIWVQRGEALKGPQGSWFGSVLSISANGEIVAGGGFYYDNGRGLVEAFVYNKGTEQWDKLGNTLTGAYEWNMFGSSIDLSSNGMFIIIGENSIENVKQCVQVFEFDGYVWNKRGSTIRGSSASDGFGSPREAVSITSSGDIIAVGSHIGDYVKMFQWKQNDWKLMMSSSTTRGADGSWFGFSVEITSINNNEFVLAVGSPGGSLTSPKLQPGAIHIYDCINDLICTERKQLIKLDYVQSIGHTLTISSDGNIVASSTEVAAVAFTWSNDTWTQLGDLMCKANEGTRNEIPVSLSSDGSIIVVGVPHDGDGFFNGRNYGEGHVFEWKRN